MTLYVLNSGSSGNGYLLEGKRSALLFECGVAPKDLIKMTPVAPSRIVGALISHEHTDHAKYIDRYAAIGVNIYASEGTLKGCEGYGRLDRAARFLHRIRPMDSFLIGEFKVSAFDVVHDAAEPLGFIIEHRECGKILFVTDTSYCKYNFRPMYIDHALIEANYDDGLLNGNVVNGIVSGARATRTKQSHMSIRQACDFIRSFQTSELKTVVLIHLSRDNANAEYFARKAEETALFSRIAVAVKGMTIELNKNENFAVL